MTEVYSLFTIVLIYLYFLFFKHRFKTDSKNFQNADVGPLRPANLQPFERRHPVAPLPAPQDAAAETLAELEQDLERLTADIPETTIDDIPIRLQRYVVAVSSPFRRFLCRVAHAVVSYREHHQWLDGCFVDTCDILVFCTYHFCRS